MKNQYNQKEIQVLSAYEIIMTVENDSDFYHALVEYAESIISDFFRTFNNGKILANPFTKSNWTNSAHLYHQFIKPSLKRIFKDGFSVSYDSNIESCNEIRNQLIEMITNGTIQIPADQIKVCELRYISKYSIKKISEITNKTPHFVNKILENFNEDTFIRYSKIQSGDRYKNVMSDCQGVIHDHPKFYPVIRIETEEQANKFIKQGSAVADCGSSLFYKSSNLTTSGKLVFVEYGENCKRSESILSLPVNVIPKQYSEHFHRFGCMQF